MDGSYSYAEGFDAQHKFRLSGKNMDECSNVSEAMHNWRIRVQELGSDVTKTLTGKHQIWTGRKAVSPQIGVEFKALLKDGRDRFVWKTEQRHICPQVVDQGSVGVVVRGRARCSQGKVRQKCTTSNLSLR